MWLGCRRSSTRRWSNQKRLKGGRIGASQTILISSKTVEAIRKDWKTPLSPPPQPRWLPRHPRSNQKRLKVDNKVIGIEDNLLEPETPKQSEKTERPPAAPLTLIRYSNVNAKQSEKTESIFRELSTLSLTSLTFSRSNQKRLKDRGCNNTSPLFEAVTLEAIRKDWKLLQRSRAQTPRVAFSLWSNQKRLKAV